jgi:hypothetical protein
MAIIVIQDDRVIRGVILMNAGIYHTGKRGNSGGRTLIADALAEALEQQTDWERRVAVEDTPY